MKSFSLKLSMGLVAALLASSMRADDIVGADGKFVAEAASGGMLEVKLGQLASERSQNDEIRKFGQRMVKDHTAANQELMAVAEKNGLKVSKELNKQHQEVYAKFSGMKGPEFDRAYINHMVKDHEEDVADFTKEARGGQNEQVRSFAAKTLPTVQEHLRLAQAIAAQLK